ncbi:DUF2812 domain-containing protein [Mumia sp. Pv 4-285]|uniref:DUF2812 domain-containing protein n=1 Tax=Mumia qirimensis TaxID=3234852 RepID=UPI00351D2A20
MSKDTRSYWFMPYRIRQPELLEVWLEDQAQLGWVAEHFSTVSAIRLTLHRREDAPTYRYAIDPRTFPNTQEDDLLSAAGWEDLGSLAGKDVWRAPYEGERPDFLFR